MIDFTDSKVESLEVVESSEVDGWHYGRRCVRTNEKVNEIELN
jgi:hypothetical protein